MALRSHEDNWPYAGPHEILLELPGCPALSEVCGEYGVFFLLAGGAAECLDFSLLFGGSAACHWQQSGGVGVAVQPRFKYIRVTQHLLGASLVVSPW